MYLYLISFFSVFLLYSSTLAQETLPLLKPVTKWGVTASSKYVSQSSDGKYLYLVSAHNWLDDFVEQALLYEMKTPNNMKAYTIHNISLEGFQINSSAAYFSEDNTTLYILGDKGDENKSYLLSYNLELHKFVRQVPLDSDLRDSHIRFEVSKNYLIVQLGWAAPDGLSQIIRGYDIETGKQIWNRDSFDYDENCSIAAFHIDNEELYVLRNDYNSDGTGDIVITKQSLDGTNEEIFIKTKMPKDLIFGISSSSDLLITDKYYVITNCESEILFFDKATKKQVYSIPAQYNVFHCYNPSNHLLAFYSNNEPKIVDVDNPSNVVTFSEISAMPMLDLTESEQACFAVPISKQSGLVISTNFIYSIEKGLSKAKILNLPYNILRGGIYLPNYQRYLFYTLSPTLNNFYLFDYSLNCLRQEDVLESADISTINKILNYSADRKYLAFLKREDNNTVWVMDTDSFKIVDSVDIEGGIYNVHFTDNSNNIYIQNDIGYTYLIDWKENEIIETLSAEEFLTSKGKYRDGGISFSLYQNGSHDAYVSKYDLPHIKYLITESGSKEILYHTFIPTLRPKHSTNSSVVYSRFDTTFYYLTDTGIWSKKAVIGSDSLLLKPFDKATEMADISISEDGKFVTVLNISTQNLYLINTNNPQDVKDLPNLILEEMSSPNNSDYFKVLLSPDNKKLFVYLYSNNRKRPIQGMHSIDISDYTSIDEKQDYYFVKEDNIKVYPNPVTSGSFSLKLLSPELCDENFDITLYSLDGQKIQTWDNVILNHNNSFALNSNLNNSIYTLQLQTHNHIYTKLLIILRD